MWILIGVVAAAGLGVGGFFLLAADDGTDPGVSDGAGPGASVSVQAGPCDPGQGTTLIEVIIDPPGSATVTVTGGDGFEQTFDGPGGSSPVGPGDYPWTAQPSGTAALSGQSSGTLTVPACGETGVSFTAQEQDLLNHIPVAMRDSCQPVPPDQALGRAAASVLCEHRGTTLFYDLFPTTAQVETYYDARVREFTVTRSSGFCDSAQRAENAYVRQRGQQQFEVGRLMCLRDAGKAVFIWTDRRVDISVEAQRDDPTNDRLYRLWARVEFGPLLPP